MSQIDLCELPEELIEYLAAFLNWEDVCACSKVNIRWRNAFNINRIWKRFCTYSSKYFSNQLSKTGYISQYDAVEDCPAKTVFFKEKFILDNAMKGLYTVTNINLGMYYCDLALDSVDDFGNHWLFLSCMENNAFENPHVMQIWNLNNDPRLHSKLETPISGLVRRLIDSEMKLIRDKLFYCTKDFVFVFMFQNPEYQLKFFYKIDLEVFGFPPNILNETAFTCVDGFIIGFFYSDYNITHNTPPFFHILDEGGKLVAKDKDFPFLRRIERTCTPALSVMSSDASKVLVIYRYYCSNFYNCFGLIFFNIRQQKFSNFHLRKVNKHLISTDMVGSIVGIIYSKVEDRRTVVYTKCYDTESEHVIFNCELNGHTFPFFKFIERSGRLELAIVENKTGIYHLYDVAQEKEIKKIELVQGSQELFFTIINSNFALLSYSVKHKIFDEVWDLRSGKRLYQLHYLSEFGFKQSFYDYSFVKNTSFPAKIIAFKNPQFSYTQVGKDTNLAIIHYW